MKNILSLIYFFLPHINYGSLYKQQLRGQQDGCNGIQKSPTKKIVEILRSGSYSLDEANDAFNRAVLSKLVRSNKIAHSTNSRAVDTISDNGKSTSSSTKTLNLSKSIDAAFEGSLHRKCYAPPENINSNLGRVVLSQLAPDSRDVAGATIKQTCFEKHIGLILPTKENIDHNSSSRVLSESAPASSIVVEESINVKTRKATPEKQRNSTEIDCEKILSELAVASFKVESSADPVEKEFIRSKYIDYESNDKILSELAAVSSSVGELGVKQNNLFKPLDNIVSCTNSFADPSKNIRQIAESVSLIEY